MIFFEVSLVKEFIQIMATYVISWRALLIHQSCAYLVETGVGAQQHQQQEVGGQEGMQLQQRVDHLEEQ